MDRAVEILPAVAAAIFNDNEEILLQKRRDVNQWCIISGHVDFGETIESAVLREIKEETNINAVVIRFIGIYSSPATQTYHYGNRTVQYITSYFQARLTHNLDPWFSNNETQELKFFKIEDIPNDLALISPYWLTDALNNDNTVFVR